MTENNIIKTVFSENEFEVDFVPDGDSGFVNFFIENGPDLSIPLDVWDKITHAIDMHLKRDVPPNTSEST